MIRRFWVFIEQVECTAHPVSWELIGVARRLADQVRDEATSAGDTVVVEAVVVGKDVKAVAEEGLQYGADHVYVVEGEVFAHYRNQAYARALVMVVQKYKPEVFFIGATTLGRDLAGAVATSLGTGLTADCTRLEMGEVKEGAGKLLLATRPAFGGNVIATIVCRTHRPQMSSVRPRVFPMPEKVSKVKGDISYEKIPIKEEEIGAKIVRLIQNEAGSAKIEYADVLVAGGRALGGPEGFNLLKDLADVLGGEVAATRPCVDAGWISVDHQVGQTGKTVRPKLYIAAGISGAIQHKVGMQDSDFILAINRDPHAPIFEVATLGIVGDLFEVIPALIQQVKDAREVQHA
ncbi:MAG: electron transfer flavoprotein subunit alpha/FixB family protein [Anaerolineaceae bacterium]|nr:electron transfer flavoprotein subunit alpha/FixB family protein [Anaerolineaceae bacterium]